MSNETKNLLWSPQSNKIVMCHPVTLYSTSWVASKKISKDTQVEWWEVPPSIRISNIVVLSRLAHNDDSSSLVVGHLSFYKLLFHSSTRIWPLLIWKDLTDTAQTELFHNVTLTRVFAFLKMWFSNIRISDTRKEDLLFVS